MLLSEKLDELEKGDESRTAIKTERARVKKASASKKTKRKYKKLDEAKAAASGCKDDGEVEEGTVEDSAADQYISEPSQSEDVSIPREKS